MPGAPTALLNVKFVLGWRAEMQPARSLDLQLSERSIRSVRNVQCARIWEARVPARGTDLSLRGTLLLGFTG